MLIVFIPLCCAQTIPQEDELVKKLVIPLIAHDMRS